MFKIGDYAVCPGHGVGQICDIQEIEFGEEKKSFYHVKIIANGMTMHVPVDSELGIRELVEDKDIADVYDVLEDHNIKIDNSTWNRRNREYSLKIKTGSLVEIAEVLRALFLLKGHKKLSTGEKNMLNECRQLIAQEISLSGGKDIGDINQKIDNFFNLSGRPQDTLDLAD